MKSNIPSLPFLFKTIPTETNHGETNKQNSFLQNIGTEANNQSPCNHKDSHHLSKKYNRGASSK